MSGDLDQLRRTVRVLELLTESYQAWERGEHGVMAAAIDRAREVDPAVVAVLDGGMRIGEVPRPWEDFAAWVGYVGAARDALAQAEREAGQ